MSVNKAESQTIKFEEGAKNYISEAYVCNKTDDDSLTISAAAAAMNVSDASVRNWIKTGYLQTVGSKRISCASLNTFRENVAGSEKLTARANKSRHDDHDHLELMNRISGLLSRPEAGNISALYENSLSQSYRNLEGVYYTPNEICDQFFSCLPADRSGFVFLDPCCGSGNFLLAAIRAGFRPENVYGCDVDKTATAIARQRLREVTGSEPTTIFDADFLSSATVGQSTIPTVHVIFTNPPWGKKLNTLEKERLSMVYSCNKSMDTSGIFLLACRKLIAPGGYYGMLLPDAFYNISSFEIARHKLLSDQIISIFDHGKSFTGILSRAVSFIARKQPSDSQKKVHCATSKGESLREQSSFLSNPASILNYATHADDALLIQHLYTIPHLTLAGRAKWALGVVTGNNKRHLSATSKEGFVPVYRGADIGINSLKPPTNFISTDMSGFQQVAPRDMYEAKEKLIYRFISSKLVFYHDTAQRMILNSANLVIPDAKFPVSMSVLAQYLSSDFVNWIYAKIFSTHKVLRSDIEKLPIFADQLSSMSDFDEISLLKKIGIEKTRNGYRVKR